MVKNKPLVILKVITSCYKMIHKSNIVWPLMTFEGTDYFFRNMILYIVCNDGNF